MKNEMRSEITYFFLDGLFLSSAWKNQAIILTTTGQEHNISFFIAFNRIAFKCRFVA